MFYVYNTYSRKIRSKRIYILCFIDINVIYILYIDLDDNFNIIYI